MSREVLLITGCSSGIGRATALEAARRGFQVVGTVRNPAACPDLVAEAKGLPLVIDQLDVTDMGSVLACVARTVERFGTVDALLANAGHGMVRFLELATESQISELFQVNTFGVMRTIQAVLPVMRPRKRGRIVVVSSVGGLVGQPVNELYCASKFAVEGLVESMATYLAPAFGIHCSLVEPAGIQTRFVNRIQADLARTGGLPSGAYGDIVGAYLTQVQARRAQDPGQTPEAVAQVIVDLLQHPQPPLRVQTSSHAQAICQEKLAQDPDGTQQLARIRRDYLGITPALEAPSTPC